MARLVAANGVFDGRLVDDADMYPSRRMSGFGSPSAAASVVAARSASELRDWRLSGNPSAAEGVPASDRPGARLALLPR